MHTQAYKHEPRPRNHRTPHTRKVQEDGDKVTEKHGIKKKQRGGEEWTLPNPRHTQGPCTRSLYRGCTKYDNEGMHKVWHVCYRQKKTEEKGEI